MQRELQGHYDSVTIYGETVRAFVPAPLPPCPAIDWTAELRAKFDQAHWELGRLDSLTALLPDSSQILRSLIRKEAVLSSRIEGFRSSLADILLFEQQLTPDVWEEDAQEVSNLVRATELGFGRLAEEFPVSLRLMRDIHGILLSGERGARLCPGEFRRSQNWIGGTRPGTAVFVPPPPASVLPCMGEFELFLNDQPKPTPPLLKAALGHIQFETIHPFLDGNGRVGRLLILLLLHDAKALRQPMLCPSLYLESHRRRYYGLLDIVRRNGDWESWLAFFADALIHGASQAAETARRLSDLFQRSRAKIAGLRNAAPSALKVHDALTMRPISASRWLVEETGISAATVKRALNHLQAAGIVQETTGKRRGRVYVYAECMEVLDGEMGFPPS